MNSDKKKLAILGVLALLMIGVGAFTFLGGRSAPAESNLVKVDTGAKPKPTAEGDTGTSADPNSDLGSGTANANGEEGTPRTEEEGKNLFALAPFQPRDPFMVPANFKAPEAAPVEPPKQAEPTNQRPKPLGSHSGEPYNPGISGPLPTYPGLGASAPVVEVKPQFIVKGILLGSKPIAVLEDSSGNQRLVALGGSIDGDTRIVAIEQGGITVVHKGKKLKFALQEEARND